MSLVLSKEQKLIQQSAREFAKLSLKPLATELDQTSEYPADAIRQLAENDFLGMFLPAACGGTEAGHESYLLVIEEISRVCAAVASILIHHSAAAYAIHRWGSAGQQQQYLPGLAAGQKLGAFAVFENGPAADANAALIATADPGGYRLHGRKTFVGNAGKADVYVVIAQNAATDGKVSTAYIVAAETPGLTIGPPRTGMGLHGYPIADVVFDNVVLPEASRLGAAGKGDSIAEETLAVTAVGEAVQSVGILQTALDEAGNYARKRVQFGQAIAGFDAVQGLLAEAITHCHLARLAAYDAATLISAGKPFLREAAMVKWFCARNIPAGLVNAIQVEGGFGYSEEAPLARLYRDIWGTAILEEPADFPERTIAGRRRG